MLSPCILGCSYLNLPQRNKSISFNSSWQPFQPQYLLLYYSLILHACRTFISHMSGQQNISVQLSDLFFPSDKYPILLFQIRGPLLNPTAFTRGQQRFLYAASMTLPSKKPQGNIGAKQRKPRHNLDSRIHSSVQLQLSTFCLTTITLWKWESWRNLQRKERLPPPSPAWNTSAVVSTCRRADRQLYELCARM